MKYEMKICSMHTYHVPLIWTFAFRGAEWWCPYCGYTGGMLGAGRNVKITRKLTDRLEKYKEMSKEYLHAKKMLDYFEAPYFPEKKKLEKIVGEYKYHKKLKKGM